MKITSKQMHKAVKAIAAKNSRISRYQAAEVAEYLANTVSTLEEFWFRVQNPGRGTGEMEGQWVW